MTGPGTPTLPFYAGLFHPTPPWRNGICQLWFLAFAWVWVCMCDCSLPLLSCFIQTHTQTYGSVELRNVHRDAPTAKADVQIHKIHYSLSYTYLIRAALPSPRHSPCERQVCLHTTHVHIHIHIYTHLRTYLHTLTHISTHTYAHIIHTPTHIPVGTYATFTATLPMTKADFTDAKQKDFKDAVAAAAKVDVSTVCMCACMYVCIVCMQV